MGELLASRALAGAFDGLAQQVHGQPLAYLDNAATTHMPQSVRQAMEAFELASRANIHRGVHTLSQRATDAFEQARATLKRFLGATAEHELVFTSGTTESLNLVANGLSDAAHGVPVLRPGDEIVTTALEHHANLVPWQLAARRSGARLLVLRPDPDGRLHADDLARLLGPRTRVFAVTACANATGERPPYEALLALAAEPGRSPCWTRPRPWPTRCRCCRSWIATSSPSRATRCTGPWAAVCWRAAAPHSNSSRRCASAATWSSGSARPAPAWPNCRCGWKAARPTSPARSAWPRPPSSSTWRAATP